jgi:hypothetical protein
MTSTADNLGRQHADKSLVQAATVPHTATDAPLAAPPLARSQPLAERRAARPSVFKQRRPFYCILYDTTPGNLALLTRVFSENRW